MRHPCEVWRMAKLHVRQCFVAWRNTTAGMRHPRRLWRTIGYAVRHIVGEWRTTASGRLIPSLRVRQSSAPDACSWRTTGRTREEHALSVEIAVRVTQDSAPETDAMASTPIADEGSPALRCWCVTLIIDPCRVRDAVCEPWPGAALVVTPNAHAITNERDAHLHQCVERCADGTVMARYVFDETYARAHPQVLEATHLALLHGTVAAKLVDDADVVADDSTLAASLHWPSHQSSSVRLGADGSRVRRRGTRT